jgi:catechol 2,3-dioxygenase-like lactoylglutathione lyase family enzyme
LNETAFPMLPCADLDETLAFYRILGFTVTYEQRKPYIYGAVERGSFGLHFYSAPAGIDARTLASRCLIMVDDVASYHREFSAALRNHYGRIPAKGTPRITRFREGQSRFTVVDPTGTWVLYVQRDEPVELEYGGSKKLAGLAKVVDNARILRDFKNDDKAAARVLKVGLARHGAAAPAVDRVRALAALSEIAIATDQPERARENFAELQQIALSDEESALVADEIRLAKPTDS